MADEAETQAQSPKEEFDQNLDSFSDFLSEEISKEKGQVQEQKPSGEAQPDAQQTGESDDLEFGDMPNGQVRYEKMKKQRDQEKIDNLDLKTRLANAEGKLSVLDKGDSPNQEEQSDPTELMSDTEKYLYQQNQKLQDQLKQLGESVTGINKDRALNSANRREEIFFKNNPDLKREQVVDQVKEFLNERPHFKQMLFKREMELGEVLAVMNSGKQSNPTPNSQDLTKVFGSGRPKAVAPGKKSFDKQDDFGKADDILNNPYSTNKGEATQVINDSLTDFVISQLTPS